MSPDIKHRRVEVAPKPFDELTGFLCGENSEVLTMMRKYSPDQVSERPFRIASLVYQDLLRSNKALQEGIFVKKLPFHLDDVKGWIEVLSVIPEDMPFHPDIPKETFPFLTERFKYTDITPFHIMDRAKIIYWVNDYQNKNGNSGFMLDRGFLHLSIADRLNDPFAGKRWNLQLDEYIDLNENYLREAVMEYNRIVVEEQPFDGKLTLLAFHRVIAQEQGRELTHDEEQKIIREGLTYQMEYAQGLKAAFEGNRNALKRFEDKVWELASKVSG